MTVVIFWVVKRPRRGESDTMMVWASHRGPAGLEGVSMEEQPLTVTRHVARVVLGEEAAMHKVRIPSGMLCQLVMHRVGSTLVAGPWLVVFGLVTVVCGLLAWCSLRTRFLLVMVLG